VISFSACARRLSCLEYYIVVRVTYLHAVLRRRHSGDVVHLTELLSGRHHTAAGKTPRREGSTLPAFTNRHFSDTVHRLCNLYLSFTMRLII